MTRRVLLLRHGRTTWNAERRYQGQADPPLDAVGRVQAHDVAGLLAALEPDALISSDAHRAAQTAEPIARLTGLSLRLDPRLRERSLGHWEGLTRDEVAVRYPDEFADWIAGRDVTRRGGETRDQVAERASAAFAELPDVALTVIVTHSATALALVTHLLGLSQKVHVLGALANCHWSELRCESEWRLRAHNVGAPGPVLPRVVDPADPDAAPDAEA